MEQSPQSSAPNSGMPQTHAPMTAHGAGDSQSWPNDYAAIFDNHTLSEPFWLTADLDATREPSHTKISNNFQVESASSEPLTQDQMQSFTAFNDENYEAAYVQLAEEPVEDGSQRKRYAESMEVSPTPGDPAPKKRRGGRKPALDWESQKATIKSFYIDQDLTLNDTMQKMADMGFEASKRKFNEMIKKWKLEKNLSSDNARFMRKKAEERRHASNKDTEFTFRNKTIPEHRYMRSTSTDDDDGKRVVFDETPSAITYGTPQGTQASAENRETLADALQFVWNGLDVNALVLLSKEAEALAKNGQITEFLDTFRKSLDGLETLLGATHVTVGHATNTFIDIAIEHELYEEAQSCLEKLLNKLLTCFGRCHPTVLGLMVKLGRVFRAQDMTAEAEITLTRLKEAVESSSDLDGEEKFQKLWVPLYDLYCIHLQNKDFLQAKGLLEAWISQSKALRSTCVSRFMHLKDLARGILYDLDPHRQSADHFNVARWAENQVTEYLEWAYLENSREASDKTYESLCCVLKQCQDRGPPDRLRLVCRITEHILNEAPKSTTTSPKKRMCVIRHLCESLMSQERFEDAEKWLVQIPKEFDSDEGNSYEDVDSFRVRIQLMVCYLKRHRWDLAEPVLREAQGQAKDLFDAESPIHSRIQDCLQTHTWSTTCMDCWTSDLHEGHGSHVHSEYTVAC